MLFSPEAFDAAFWMGRAYALIADKSRDSPHATAAAMNSSAGRNRIRECLQYLEAEIAAGCLGERVTPYFAYFVVRAFGHLSHAGVCDLGRPHRGQLQLRQRSVHSESAAAHRPCRCISNHFSTYAAFAIMWLGRWAMSCGAPGTRTSTVSTLRSFSAW